MKKLIILSLLIAFTASARIGETKAECIKRYGKVKIDFGTELEFNFNGFKITTYFMNNKCEFIRYEKVLKQWIIFRREFLRRPKIEDQELQLLLKANRLNGWKASKAFFPKTMMDAGNKDVWYNKNLTAGYHYKTYNRTFKEVDLYGTDSFRDYFFVIYSKKYHDLITNQEKVKAESKAKFKAWILKSKSDEIKEKLKDF